MLIQSPQPERHRAFQFLEDLPNRLEQVFTDWGLAGYSPLAASAALLLALIAVAVLVHFLLGRVCVHWLHRLVKRSRAAWDDAVADHRVFLRLAHLVPALILYVGAELFFASDDLEWLRAGIQRLSLIYMVFMGTLALSSFLGAVNQIYENSFRDAKKQPIRSFIQIGVVAAWVVAVILVISVLIGESPVGLLAGLGAMSAVLLLVFKDAILGFVASIQISTNDMVRIGDWVTLPQHGADGNVIAINLTTVKIRNWDQTIATVPTYALVSESVQNWRGMSESGGRRIKRAVLIDLSSIRFVDEEMLERFRKIQYIQEYLERKAMEIREWNADRKADESSLVNGRHLTNVGTFRAYVYAYLKHHPQISESMTFLVRQLPPTEKGLPIEIYVFSTEQRWAQYEDIQSDIFDHVLASVPEFGLRVVQAPTGADLRALVGHTGPEPEPDQT